MAQQVLKHLTPAQDRRVTIDTIQKAVAEKFGIRQIQLKEKSNTRTIVYPRQVAMFLVKELTAASLHKGVMSVAFCSNNGSLDVM
jgi:chromosomal replication initiator protein